MAWSKSARASNGGVCFLLKAVIGEYWPDEETLNLGDGIETVVEEVVLI